MKVAIVTAASHGIGLACAQALASKGYRLGIMSRTDEIERVAATMDAFSVRGSVSSPSDLGALVDGTLSRYGRIDAVICNSGHPAGGALLDISDASWQEVFEMYFLSVVRISRLVVPIMQRQRSGALLVITANDTFEPDLRFPVATTIRPAMTSFMKLFSREYAKHGIRMNALAPGVACDEPSSISESLKDELPMQRAASYAEVAKCAAFLLSDEASYVTGETLRVDGGQSRAV